MKLEASGIPHSVGKECGLGLGFFQQENTSYLQKEIPNSYETSEQTHYTTLCNNSEYRHLSNTQNKCTQTIFTLRNKRCRVITDA